MKERVFTDTNILIYHFTQEAGKYKFTDAIIANPAHHLVTSTKVLSEFANVCLRKKFVKGKSEIKAHIEAVEALFEVVGLSDKDVLKALDLQDRYKISFYDALIVANALHAGCQKLYSEDMHHGLLVERKLRIINPFK